jgi:hypothetical protein
MKTTVRFDLPARRPFDGVGVIDYSPGFETAVVESLVKQRAPAGAERKREQ